MESLAKLFGGGERVRILRYFMLNNSTGVSKRTLSEALLITPQKIAREVAILETAGILKRRGGASVVRSKKRSVRTQGTDQTFSLNLSYPYLAPLRDFIVATLSGTRDDAVRAMFRAGVIKIVIASGLFEEQWEGRLDFLIVGEKIDEKTLKRALRKTEAELGHEIRFAALTSDDYRYRMSVHDKLIRDVLDYPHTILLDKRKHV